MDLVVHSVISTAEAAHADRHSLAAMRDHLLDAPLRGKVNGSARQRLSTINTDCSDRRAGAGPDAISAAGGKSDGPDPPITYRVTPEPATDTDLDPEPATPPPRTASAASERARTDAASLAGQHIRSAAGRLVEHWVPDGLRGSRVSPGRSGAMALAVVAALAAVAAAIGAWWQRPAAEAVPELPVASGVAHQAPGVPAVAARSGHRSGGRAASSALDPAAPPTSQPAGGTIVVSMIGRVNHPGLVSIPDGSRVADAMHAAGDAVPGTDLHGLNLARRLDDGEQLDVGAPAPADGGSAVSGGSGDGGSGASGGAGGSTRSGKRSGSRAAGSGAKVNINRATADQLLDLSGVGQVTAQRIVDWRTRHGRFTSIDQLREVGGIGPAKFNRLKESVTL